MGERELDLGLVVAAVLGLALSACLWWTYFGGDDDRAAEEAPAAAPVAVRFRMALEGFGHAHLGLLLAIVAVAAGLEAVGHRPGEELDTPFALLLGGGAGGFLVADAAFRHRLGIGSAVLRLAAALPAVASTVVGITVVGVAQVVVLVAVFVALFAVEAGRRSGARGRRPM